MSSIEMTDWVSEVLCQDAPPEQDECPEGDNIDRMEW